MLIELLKEFFPYPMSRKIKGKNSAKILQILCYKNFKMREREREKMEKVRIARVFVLGNLLARKITKNRLVASYPAKMRRIS